NHISRSPPPPQTHTLSLHDALPILLALGAVATFSDAGAICERRGQRSHGEASQCRLAKRGDQLRPQRMRPQPDLSARQVRAGKRSEEHTSELQSRGHLVCRLLLEKK